MSCIKDTPVMAMERLCKEKLKCWVRDQARKVRGVPSRTGQRLTTGFLTDR
jgi:hypothetical protein